MRCECATRPSRSSTRSVASAAAAARSLPPNVEPWRTARSIPSNTCVERARVRRARRRSAPARRRAPWPGRPCPARAPSARARESARCARGRSAPRRRRTARRRSRHRRCAPRQIALGRQVDALALHRLDDERRHVAARELAAPARPASPNATASQPGSSGPKPSRNSAFPFSDSEPSVRPWKACSAYSTRGRPVAARATLIAASTASVPAVRRDHRRDAVGRAREQLLGEHAAEQRHAELRQVARARRHHLAGARRSPRDGCARSRTRRSRRTCRGSARPSESIR